MTVNLLPSDRTSPLTSPIVLSWYSGNRSKTGRLSSGVPNSVHVRSTSWRSQGRALCLVCLLALLAFPAPVFAAPPALRLRDGVQPHGPLAKRQNSNPQDGNSSNNGGGGVSMSIWLPILLVTLVFVLFTCCICARRCLRPNAGAATRTNANGTSTPANGNTANTTRPSRRPRRTPSQISTKSLPAYMKEPGDQELVLFRGPLETEDDDQALPHAIPALAEDDEHPEMRNATFDITLDRIESVDTMGDSTTNLMRKMSAVVARPPEVHHTAMSHDHHRSGDGRSLDSVGSEVELLPAHRRVISVDNHADPRGETPSYTEAVSVQAGMTTISLNDPEPNVVSHRGVVPPLDATDRTAGRERLRFSFLRHNPFSSHHHTGGASSNANPSPTSIRSESPGLQVQSGSALSRFSTRESHESHHSRTPSRNNNLSRTHTRSNSNLLRAFRSHSPGLHAGSSTISLDSISAPLTHTLTRAEFHAPKGGLMTPEQIKLITSREALERFGVPYGPDAVAAFSLSRERLADMGPPPNFESATGEGSSETSGTTEAAAQGSGTVDAHLETAPPRSASLSPVSHSSLSHRPDARAESRASSPMSYATAPESDGEETAQVYTSGAADEPYTARPMTPTTARPLSLSGNQGSVVKRP